MVLTGHMDESYNTKMFTYSCVLGRGSVWLWLTSEWKKRLRKKNKSLRKQGRKELSRYHASDCSNLKNDFAGWSSDEQISFVKPLIAAAGKRTLYAFAFSLPFDELLSLVPTDQENALRNAYQIAVCFLMLDIGAKIHKSNPSVKINLIHDRSAFDTVILDAFNFMKNDTGFRYRDMFISITPMGWEDCVPLQPADMAAYEAFKESCRVGTSRNRRKSLEGLVKMGKFGIRLKLISGEHLERSVEILRSHNCLYPRTALPITAA
jgi:hypothetical protein